nr:MAG TPA: hypothetical protein [Caudoviricetes sp.]
MLFLKRFFTYPKSEYPKGCSQTFLCINYKGGF